MHKNDMLSAHAMDERSILGDMRLIVNETEPTTRTARKSTCEANEILANLGHISMTCIA